METSFVIQASERKGLRRKINEINEIFKVKVEVILEQDVSIDDIQWVHVKGTNKDNIEDAKTHIIALCSPEITERVAFSGFPLFIFTAFNERCKHNVQRECGVVLSITDDEYLIIQGSNIGVTLAISQIHHLKKLHQDKDPNKEREAALQFDLYVEEINDDLQEELQALSNALKKELLNLLNMPVTAGVETVPKELKSSAKQVYPTLHSSGANGATASTSSESQKSSILETITIKDSSDEYESDDSDKAPNLSLDHDGIEENFLLPPNFVILEWIKVNYEATNDSTDFVNKIEMLDHFKTHFDLTDDPQLANRFFDKLAVRIFPSDPNYRAVKTKKTKSKYGRRRLICLRRRTHIDDEKEITQTQTKITLPKTVASSTSPLPSVLTSAQFLQNKQIMQSTPNVVKDWNASRTGLSTIPPNRTNQPQTVPRPLPSQPQTVPPIFFPNSNPQNSRNNIPPNPLPHSNPQNLQTWLESASAPQPVIKPRTQPQYQPNRQANLLNSIAKRVSDMSNQELVRKPRPPVDPKLRPIVIDGSNVAMNHGNHSNFSCRGIAICIRFFVERGHGSITCFVPNYRKGGGGNPPSSDAYLLVQLEKEGFVKSTPSRRIQGRNIVCYDDRFIVELAGAVNGVILSNDQYRDLMAENRKFRSIIEQQLLQYTFVNDLLMLPEDPLGRTGPSLEQYLTQPNTGPSTPPRQKLVKVPASARRPVQPNTYGNRPRAPVQPNMYGNRPHVPVQPNMYGNRPHAPVTGAWLDQPTAPSELSPDQVVLCYEMMRVFPNRENDIRKVISNHPLERDIENLMNYLLISDSG